MTKPSHQSRQIKGLKAHLSGQSAEMAVQQSYAVRGASLCATRWRGEAGEIDLIFRDGNETVFCEVKKARSHDAACSSLSQTQIRRIIAAAGEYLATRPDLATCPLRFDLATMDAAGSVHILSNAFGEF